MLVNQNTEENIYSTVLPQEHEEKMISLDFVKQNTPILPSNIKIFPATSLEI